MNKIVLIPLFFALNAYGQRDTAKPDLFADSNAPVEQRIDDLLRKMTIEEKIDAFSTNPTVPRLGIVGTNHVEGLHGLALGGPGHWEGRNETVIRTTTFPQERGLGQTWDPELMRQVAALEAYEARYAYGKYHRGGMVVRAPNADLSRDPRWGRSEESIGEDPFLTGTMATAFSHGLQGDGKYWTAASLLKHFMANSNENGRGSSSSDFDERLFREYYSVPFRMAIQQGHANAFMASYNAWNGTPMMLNPILRDVVQKQWGEDGIMCTDGGALTNLVKEYHRFPNMTEASAAAIHAGINQFLDTYKPGLTDAVEKHLVTEAEMDRNLRGVFRVMIKLGLLDGNQVDPFAKIGFDEQTPDPWWNAAPKALVRKATDESIVLLKNDGILPLKQGQVKSIAVIGPLADKVIYDWYSGTPPYTVTPYAGIKAMAGAGANVTYSDGKDLAAAATLAKASDVAIVVIGNHPWCDAGWEKCPTPSDGKEAVDRKSLTLEQEEIAKAVYAANPKTIVVLQASFPYTTNWTQENIPAVLTMTHNSEEQGNGLADVLFGAYNPGGKLTQTWVKDIADLPPMMDYNIRDGRTYMYAKQKPLYPFGFGLSYTTFAYSHLKLSQTSVRVGAVVHVTADVTNTGKLDGDEIVEMYVAHKASQVGFPNEALKAFARVHLKPGQTLPVALELPAQELAYWDEKTQAWALEPGQIEVMVGGSSDKLPLTATLQVAK